MKRVYIILLVCLITMGCSNNTENGTGKEKASNQPSEIQSRFKQMNGYKISEWDGTRFFVVISPSKAKDVEIVRNIVVDTYNINKELLNQEKDRWNISFFTDEKHANYKTNRLESKTDITSNKFNEAYVAEYWRKGQDLKGDNIIELRHLDNKQVRGPKIFN